MWLSKTIALGRRPEQESADMGVTTIGGGSASVMTRGEQRDLAVFAPGGLVWQPRAGDAVLVVKGGTGGREQCVVAADTAAAAPEDMAPGELYLYASGGASVYLRSDGGLILTGETELRGPVAINGTLRINGELIINGEACRPAASPRDEKG